jgi:hypothetical protein
VSVPGPHEVPAPACFLEDAPGDWGALALQPGPGEPVVVDLPEALGHLWTAAPPGCSPLAPGAAASPSRSSGSTGGMNTLGGVLHPCFLV